MSMSQNLTQVSTITASSNHRQMSGRLAQSYLLVKLFHFLPTIDTKQSFACSLVEVSGVN